MAGTYYETNIIAAYAFVAFSIIMVLIMLRVDRKNAERKERNYMCECCKRRGGVYPPSDCLGKKCKFFD